MKGSEESGSSQGNELGVVDVAGSGTVTHLDKRSERTDDKQLRENTRNSLQNECAEEW